MRNKLYIGIVGFGNMGSAVGEALLSEGTYEISIYDTQKKKLKGIEAVNIAKSLEELIGISKVVLIAIKPQDIEDFIKKAHHYLSKKKPLLISIAAGVSTSYFEKRIKGIRVIRVMPNLAAKVRNSVSFLCRGKNAKKEDLNIAIKIFSYVGKTFTVRENFLDKVTSISGSGPGYIYYFMDAIMKAALRLGFSRQVAKEMVEETFMGAVKLAVLSGKDFSQLIKDVSSKGGTTERAIDVFNKKKMDSIIYEAVSSAYRRAKELAKD